MPSPPGIQHVMNDSLSKLFIGPSFKNGPFDKKHLDRFAQKVDDEGATFLLNLWLAKTDKGLPRKSDLDPLLFPKLLPQIIIEEFHEESGESRVRLIGEFYRDIYTKADDQFGKLYLDRINEKNVADDWRKSDIEIYTNYKPTLHYYDLSGIDKNYIRLGELCLPMVTDKGQIQSLSYAWRISLETLSDILDSNM